MLDDIDKRLLRILQRNGKSSTQELSQAADVSASPAWRRVRRLEDSGIIRQVVALLDRRKLGLNTLAYIHVSLTDHSEVSIQTFDRFTEQEDRVVECCSITGQDDYMIKVVARDAEDLEQFLMSKLLSLGIVRNSTTHMVLRQKKFTTALPLD